MTTETQQITVPLNKLTAWTGNVRKTGIEAGLDELAASIRAHGLITPLTVGHGAKGRHVVIAGQRRLLALQRLAKGGAMAKTAPIPCILAAEDQDAAELSLAENVVRTAMHPADQFEAWRDLIEGGASVPGIAARFGMPESTVQKRLALARVSPRLFDLYRQEAISLEGLQAFTVTDDHALQEAVWNNAPSWQRNDHRSLRRALTETAVPTADKRVRFVTLEVYEAAGGAVRRDLFDPDGGGFVQDAALLERLVRERLDAIAAEVKAEGWHWTEGRTCFDWQERQDFEQGQLEVIEIGPEIEAEAEALADELECLDEEDGRYAVVAARLDAIIAMRSRWPDDLKAYAGAIVSIDHWGAVEIERGLIRAGDVPAADRDEERDEDDADAKVNAAPALSAPMIEELTAQKTAALRIETARNPDVALALIVQALVAQQFYRGGDSVLKAHVARRDLRSSIRQFDTCPAVQALTAEQERIGERLPGQHKDVWDWCLAADRETLLDVLAVTVAHGVDAVEGRGTLPHAARRHGAALADALKLDMRTWFQPTEAGYFSRISKAQILADLEAARGQPCAPSWAKMKKNDLAALAERETAECGWLPSPLH